MDERDCPYTERIATIENDMIWMKKAVESVDKKLWALILTHTTLIGAIIAVLLRG